ncbi:MAG: hypothetical protein ACLTZU_16355 [Odoribacter splanchnicus]
MKNIILIVLLLWSGVGVWAQDKLTDEKRKEFDAQKSLSLHRNWTFPLLKQLYSGLCTMRCRRKTGK